MSNLKPKTDEKGNPTSISQVSRLLRGKVEEPMEEPQVSELPEHTVNRPEIKENPQQTLVQGTKLENMILEAKQNREPKTGNSPVILDGDLYDIFALLKAKKKVAAARIVSMICRDWVKDNKHELELMLGQKIELQ